MKGLLRGLKYISHIFEDNKQHEEMQIGFPTDVKHVAHIGMDGQSSTSTPPTWMNGFKSVPELANQTSSASNGPLMNSTKCAVEDVTRKAAAEVEDSQTRNEKARHRDKSRRKAAGGGGGNSSPPGSPAKQKRHSTSKTISSENPGADDSSSNNTTSRARRKKTRGANSGGTATRGGKSKGQNYSTDTTLSSDNDSGEFPIPTKNNNNNPLTPILEEKR